MSCNILPHRRKQQQYSENKRLNIKRTYHLRKIVLFWHRYYFYPEPEEYQVGCSSAYSKIFGWVTTCAKLVASTFPPRKKNLFGVAPPFCKMHVFPWPKLKWCINILLISIPSSTLRYNHPKILFLGPDSWQIFNIAS